jgi:hypothetical protein
MAANSLTESPRLPGRGIQSHVLVPTTEPGVPRCRNHMWVTRSMLLLLRSVSATFIEGMAIQGRRG